MDRVEIVTDSCEHYFAKLEDSSISKFNFSNIFEWMSPAAFENLLRETVRVARDRAVLTYRNLLVFRERPPSLGGEHPVPARPGQGAPGDRPLFHLRQLCRRAGRKGLEPCRIPLPPSRTRRRLDEFLRLPFAHLSRRSRFGCRRSSAQVRRMLDPERNPYFANATLRLFVCYQDGTPVARMAVIINSAHQKAFGVRSAFFGFFESANDEAAARRLFGEAEGILPGQERRGPRRAVQSPSLFRARPPDRQIRDGAELFPVL